jgi:O-antigen/teichoic acid export membrane protein
MKSLTGRAFILGMGGFLQKGSGLVVVLLLVRLLDKDGYGTYQQILYVAGILYGIFASGMSAGIYYFLPRLDFPGRRKFLRQTISILAVFASVAALSVYRFGPEISHYFGNAALERALVFYAAYVFFWIGGDFFLPFLNASGRYTTSMLCAVGESVANAVFLVIPLWTGAALPEAIGILAMAAGIRYCLYVVSSLRMVRGEDGSVEAITVGRQLRYSFPLMMAGWTDLVGNYLDKVVVSVLYTPAMVAIYSVGTIRIPLWDIVAKPVNIVLRVKFAEIHGDDRIEQMRPIWSEAVRKQSIVVLPIFFLMWATANHLIPLLFTDSYEQSTAIFRIALLDKPLMVMSFSVFPLVLGRPDFMLKGSLLFAAASTLLMFAVGTKLGLYGPIIVVVCAQYLHYSFYAYVIVRRLGVPGDLLFPMPVLVRVFASNFIAAGVCYALCSVIASHVVALAVGIAAYGITYMAAIVQMGVLRQGDMQTVMRYIPYGRRLAGRFR